jgi:hypothetical protein
MDLRKKLIEPRVYEIRANEKLVDKKVIGVRH